MTSMWFGNCCDMPSIQWILSFWLYWGGGLSHFFESCITLATPPRRQQRLLLLPSLRLVLPQQQPQPQQQRRRTERREEEDLFETMARHSSRLPHYLMTIFVAVICFTLAITLPKQHDWQSWCIWSIVWQWYWPDWDSVSIIWAIWVWDLPKYCTLFGPHNDCPSSNDTCWAVPFQDIRVNWDKRQLWIDWWMGLFTLWLDCS